MVLSLRILLSILHQYGHAETLPTFRGVNASMVQENTVYTERREQIVELIT